MLGSHVIQSSDKEIGLGGAEISLLFLVLMDSSSLSQLLSHLPATQLQGAGVASVYLKERLPLEMLSTKRRCAFLFVQNFIMNQT